MVSIPAGEFTMGSQDGDPDERPAHKVHVDAFSMDVYEVTVGQYAAFLQATGFNSPLDWQTMNQPAHQKRPVANVDWVDAAAYCKWAGKRLPTEAEWEKAARGTDGRLYPWGNDSPTPLHANYGKTGSHNYGALALVGTLEDGKSPYGIYDMAGNVWEWVSDWYDNDYYKNSPPAEPDGTVNGRVQSDPWRLVEQQSAESAIRRSVLGSAVVPELILSRVPMREDSVAGILLDGLLRHRPKVRSS